MSLPKSFFKAVIKSFRVDMSRLDALSALYVGMPMQVKTSDMIDLPLPIPPVIPMRFMARCFSPL